MAESKSKKDCFVIMPIGDPDGYTDGHFRHVYENIIQPACEQSDLKPVRADDVKETNLIHLDILRKLIDSPIAVCDLSSRNPNVLFELGVRQAFDKPIVLIQEKGTSKIFDIAPLRYLEYSKEMKYHDVLRSQKELKESILATLKADADRGNVNSIVKLLALSNPAAIPDMQGDKKETFALEILQSELRDMRHMMDAIAMDGGRRSRGSIAAVEYERISNRLDQIANSRRIPMEKKHEDLQRLMGECEELMMYSLEKTDHMHFRHLMHRLHRTMEEIA